MNANNICNGAKMTSQWQEQTIQIGNGGGVQSAAAVDLLPVSEARCLDWIAVVRGRSSMENAASELGNQ